MADFQTALQYVIANEGGYVNNPADRGGPTKFGMTLATLTAYRAALKLTAPTADTMKLLTLSDVAPIYQSQYWRAVGGDQLRNQGLATALLDAAVLNSPRTAVTAMQHAYNAVGPDQLVVDGSAGPKSVAGFDALCVNPALMLGFIFQLQTRFVMVVQANPTQRQFLLNWARRTASYSLLLFPEQAAGSPKLG